HLVFTRVVLKIVAGKIFDASRRRQLRQEVGTVILVPPELVIADGRLGAWRCEAVPDLVVVRVPLMRVAFEEQFDRGAWRKIELRAENVLVALVELRRQAANLTHTRARRLQEVELAVRELVRGAEAKL